MRTMNKCISTAVTSTDKSLDIRGKTKAMAQWESDILDQHLMLLRVRPSSGGRNRQGITFIAGRAEQRRKQGGREDGKKKKKIERHSKRIEQRARLFLRDTKTSSQKLTAKYRDTGHSEPISERANFRSVAFCVVK
jgi:hypothetical protein